MGSSGETCNKGIDASVGGLVWVRRRNGSWWPGRIMGLDELSESCLVSPRSGTPVKLLGREDASVDWYNLEKSKRVKAFRCGEYDECIEKAKVSAANTNKKAVKYARREDAILHALEIENARLGKDRLEFSARMDNSGGEHGSSARESPSMSNSGNENGDMEDDVSDSEDNSDSAQELSQSGISFEEPNHTSSSKVQSVQGRRRRTPNDSEDDGTEGVKRMRGLEDLGIGVGCKRKVHAGGLLELVQQDNASLSDSSNVNCMSNGISVNGGKSNSSLRRKRSQVANVHEFLKRKNRRRPLTKVLESTAMVSVPVVCNQLPPSCGSPHGGLTDGKVSGIESTESKRSLSVVINNNSDSTVVSCENGTLDASDQACDASQINSKEKEIEIPSISGLAENDSSDRLFDVPFVGEEKHSSGLSPLLMPSSSGRPQIGSLRRQSSQSSLVEALSMKNEGINESGSTSSAAVHADIGPRIEKGTSEWQLKGKRNSRVNKDRKQDSRKYVDINDESNACLAGIEHLDGFSQGSDLKVDCNGTTGSFGSYNCTLQANSKPVSEDQADGLHDWSKHLPPRECNMRGSTSEVKLLPDASLTPQRLLPYRQSRFTNNSRYQSSDFSTRNYCPDASLYDVKLEVKAKYRPPHVPLVSLMSKLNGKAIVGHPLTVEVLDESYCDNLLSRMEHDLEGGEMVYGKPYSVSGRTPTKHLVLQPRHSPRKSPKTKKSGLLPKKIRKLSSLTGHKQSEERKQVVEKPKAPLIACIPLKLVFSRINEAMNGSARQTHRILTSSNT
ncbi:uncharacterized protein At1g51745 isoform X1 [Ziziphus jujuba]|uniref:Uncharacterized protein At1g51745 isoform X1 n=1 Tax=Ziziphus jujuba TaxID=326968 RepID=A0A6P3YRS9_ZIZJJ|nr:uncharacterized protein At1g51745 isoform X1 [Ziziphus jujuba]XP_015866559.2 uncharacterized protein At1g51745 isoform X1 [Ziziphus jujuba]